MRRWTSCAGVAVLVSTAACSTLSGASSERERPAFTGVAQRALQHAQSALRRVTIGARSLVSPLVDQEAALETTPVEDLIAEEARSSGFGYHAMQEGGVAVLHVVGGPPEGIRTNLAFEMTKAIREAFPGVTVLSQEAVEQAIRQAGIAPDVANWLAEYEARGVVDRALLQALARATGARHFLIGRINTYVKADEEYPLYGTAQQVDSDVQPFLTRPKVFLVTKEVRLEGEILDSRGGGLVWRGAGGARQVESPQAESLRMEELFIRAARNLVAALPDERLQQLQDQLAQLEAKLTSATARILELEGDLTESTAISRAAAASRERALQAKIQQLEPKLAEVMLALTKREETLGSMILDLKAQLIEARLAAARRVEELETQLAEAEAARSRGLRIDTQAQRITLLEGMLADLEGRFEKSVEALRQAELRSQKLEQASQDRVALITRLRGEIEQEGVKVVEEGGQVRLQILGTLLFPPGSSRLTQEGEVLLARVSETLARLAGRQIRVEGHTDNVPIQGRLALRFPTNWELSTARATQVVRFLVQRGVDPTRLTAVGYGEFRPVAPNDTEEGRRQNRRIEIALTEAS